MNSKHSTVTKGIRVSPPPAASILDASIDGMIALDTDFKITVWNNTAAAWSGRSADTLIGKKLYRAFPAAKLVPGLESALQRALHGMKSLLPVVSEFYMPGYFEVHVVPLQNEAGTITGVVQIIHDIAHRLKAEQALKALNRDLSRQNAALEAANEELAAFSKITAHDLKEPLRKIYTFAELIMMREAAKLSNDGRAHFRRIQKGVQRMSLLTDDMVNFSELSRSGPPEDVDMNTLLAAELERLGEEIVQTQAQLECTSLPHLSGYPVALAQLLRQVLGNALKFRKPDTPPRIRLRCVPCDGSAIEDPRAQPDQTYYHLSVADNGIGFEPQYRSLIFNLFQRLHPEGTYRGSGMGLAIAQKAARMHDGFMTAESTPGGGSTFHCYIPVH